MLQVLVVKNRSQDYSKAVELALPLYRKAPYHSEELRDRDYERPGGLFPSSPLSMTKWTVAQVLARALERDGQYPKYLAVHAGSYFRKLGSAPPHDTPVEADWAEIMRRSGKEYPVAVTVNDVWVDFRSEPVLQEGCVFVPLAQLAPHLGFEAEIAKGQARIELRRKEPPRQLLFEDGKKDVGPQEGAGLKLEHAPFKREGSLLVPAAELAKLLNGQVHWYPQGRFMHLIIPKVPAKPAEQ
jgi:hypothetical protein